MVPPQSLILYQSLDVAQLRNQVFYIIPCFATFSGISLCVFILVESESNQLVHKKHWNSTIHVQYMSMFVQE